MRKFLILSLVIYQSIYGESPLDLYFRYITQLNQPKGSYEEGEIELVLDPLQIDHIQKVQETRLLKKGFSAIEAAEFSRVGVVNEDQYLIWLRDAVYFPKKIPGTYDRIFWKSALNKNFAGVAILPFLPSGKVVLILTYRHATRSWELELPRGMIDFGETPEKAALRELKEETGFIASDLTFLGNVAPDTGILPSVIPVFMAHVDSEEKAAPEFSEAIAKTVILTKDALKAGLTHGFLELTVQGENKRVPLRDAFLTFALLQAEYRNLLEK